MDIRTLCLGIVALLKEVGETNWSVAFESFIADLNAYNQRHVYKKMFAIYGGAGSFNDLVLHTNGTACLDENNKLDVLRKQLYEALVLHLYIS